MRQILLVEDDLALARGVALGLASDDTQVTSCGALAAARDALSAQRFDLLILDIGLPDGSGLEFCREVRAGFARPILFLTANDTEMDVVAGLETGGDDYITKPFSLAVLRARVGALLRRGEGAGPPQTFEIDTLCFDFENMRFAKGGQPVELSKTEQRLLHLLLAHRGSVLPREVMLSRIWPDGAAWVDENALSVAVRRLRAKLEENPSDPRYIKTVHGIGYTWAVWT